jgi:adenosylhomocysteine nucleosidase
VETILLVAAEARELVGIARHCRRAVKLAWPLRFARSGELDGRRLLMVANGTGPAAAGEAADVAVNREKIDVMISAGFCGALDPSLEVGEVFVASNIEVLERGESFEGRAPVTTKPYASGSLLSVDRVVQTADEKRRLHGLGAAVVEMEASAVASCANKWDLPFFCVRVVTDRADESFVLDFNAARDGDGQFQVGRIVRAALRRPTVVLPELFEMHRRSRLAATTMGDFLAHSRF